MRISDWSSDVCSSDLSILEDRNGKRNAHQNLRPSGRTSPGVSALLRYRQPSTLEYRSKRLASLPVWLGLYPPAQVGPHLPIRRSCSDSGERRIPQDDADFVGRSEEHTSELQSIMRISYTIFGL